MAVRLTLLVAAGVLERWAYVGDCAGYELRVDGVLVGRYRPDFATWGPLGQQLIEVKGRMARDVPLRLRVFRARYPALALHVVSSALVDVYDPRVWPPKAPSMARKSRLVAPAV